MQESEPKLSKLQLRVANLHRWLGGGGEVGAVAHKLAPPHISPGLLAAGLLPRLGMETGLNPLGFAWPNPCPRIEYKPIKKPLPVKCFILCPNPCPLG